MLVLGVDPGSMVTGYGLVEKKNNRIVYVKAGSVSSDSRVSFCERIHKIFVSMVDIMEQYRPAEMSIEDIFFARNVKSSLKLGHARGAVMVAAAQCGIRIFEYTPLEIKKSVVGYGRASKEQIRSMMQIMLKLPHKLGPDTSDALAAAVCHLNWTRYENR